MTRERAKELLPIITAFSQGKTIQTLRFGGHFMDDVGPSFDGDPECYRVKPEPREWWVTLNVAGSALSIYENKDRAVEKSCGDLPIKVREVIE